MPAKDSLLGTLHEQLAAKYIAALKDPEAPPALLTSAAKFLKDNGIVCEVGDEQMDELRKQTATVLQMPFRVSEA